MNFEFILDKNYLAFFILYIKMKEIEDIKNKLYSDNELGYKKILEQELLDLSIYLKDETLRN